MRFSFLAGVVNEEDRPRFERMLFLATKGEKGREGGREGKGKRLRVEEGKEERGKRRRGKKKRAHM